LTELSDTFDQMLGRLDAAFSGQRLFIANASHELRTPLTRIRTKLDVTLAQPHVTAEDLDEMAGTIRDAVDRSSRLISSLLALARAQGELLREPVDLQEICRGIAAELQDDAERRWISLTTDISECLVRETRRSWSIWFVTSSTIRSGTTSTAVGSWWRRRREEVMASSAWPTAALRSLPPPWTNCSCLCDGAERIGSTPQTAGSVWGWRSSRPWLRPMAAR
jgi:hypothetical protein